MPLPLSILLMVLKMQMAKTDLHKGFFLTAFHTVDHEIFLRKLSLHSVNSLIYRELRFFKNHGRGDQDFLVKMVVYRRGKGTAFHK